MPVMDEFKEERATIKNAPFKEKVKYFIDYYKWHTIAVIVISALVISLVYTFLTKKDVAHYVAIINGVETNQVEYFTDQLNERFQLDTKKQEIRLDSGYRIDESKYNQTTTENVQKISIYVSASDVDNIVSDSVCFEKYAYLDTFMDLRKCLTGEQIEKYQDHFFYIDNEVLKEQTEIRNSQDYTKTLEYPDPSKPEEMKDPVPVGIYLSGIEEETKLYSFADEMPVIGVVRNTERLEQAVDFIEAWYEYIPNGQVSIPGVTQ